MIIDHLESTITLTYTKGDNMSITNALLSNLRKTVAATCPRKDLSVEELMNHSSLINIIANYRQLHFSEQEIITAVTQGKKEAECIQEEK